MTHPCVCIWPTHPGAENDLQWYYSLGGQRIGPVSNAAITQLLAAGTINNGTFVWRAGFDGWIPISQTTLLRKIITKPPPLAGAAVNNSLAWIIAFSPIVGRLLLHFIAGAINVNPTNLWLRVFLFSTLYTLLCGIDYSILKQAGHDAKNFGGWVFVVPVYLYKRATLLHQPLGYFVTWIICFFVSQFFAVVQHQ